MKLMLEIFGQVPYNAQSAYAQNIQIQMTERRVSCDRLTHCTPWHITNIQVQNIMVGPESSYTAAVRSELRTE